MSKSITVSLSDTDYEALQAISAQRRQSPEQVVAGAIALVTRQQQTLPQTPSSPAEIQQAKDAMLAEMRAQGHLVDPSTLAPYPGVSSLPPVGSPERAQLEDEVGEALSDALEQSGKSILDLIDR